MLLTQPIQEIKDVPMYTTDQPGGGAVTSKVLWHAINAAYTGD